MLEGVLKHDFWSRSDEKDNRENERERGKKRVLIECCFQEKYLHWKSIHFLFFDLNQAFYGNHNNNSDFNCIGFK